jgi:hypothetical protein
MARKQDLHVFTPVPRWRRSLTESGMGTAPTRSDRIVIAVFFVGFLAVLAYIVQALG